MSMVTPPSLPPRPANRADGDRSAGGRSSDGGSTEVTGSAHRC